VSGAALFRAGLLAAFGGAVRRGWTGVGRGSKEGGSRAASPRPQAPQAPHDGLLSVATQAHPAGEPARWLHPLGREALAEASAALPSEAVAAALIAATRLAAWLLLPRRRRTDEAGGGSGGGEREGDGDGDGEGKGKGGATAAVSPERGVWHVVEVFGLDHFGVAAPSLLADRAARDLFWQSHLRWLAQLDVWHACL